MRHLLPLTALALAGCTFAPGEPWARLVDAELQAILEPGPARDLGDDTVLTDLGYEVTVEAGSLGIVGVELLELEGGTEVAFDPANPPPGYSLCHGGHCHADSGGLVDYATIEAELAGPGAAWVPVVTLPVEADVDLLAGPTLVLDDAVPSDELPRTTVALLEIPLDHLELEGTVTGGPEEGGLGASSVPFALDPPLDATLAHGMDLVIDRDQAPRIGLEVAIAVDGTLFDGLDFAALDDGGVIALDEAATATLRDNLTATDPDVQVTTGP